jgi:CSLREA domain-containing protein
MTQSLIIRFAILVLLLTPTQALSALITVNTLDDESNADGDCSLREAAQSANLNISVDQCVAGEAAGDTIFINQTGTLNLNGSISFAERVEVFGPGRDALTVSGQGTTSIFIVNMPDDTHDFELSLMTLADASESSPGPAVWIQRGGTFRLEQLRLTGNRTSAAGGGAVAVELEDDTGDVSGLEVIRCVFEGNEANDRGGAMLIAGAPIFQPLDSLLIEETLFSDNVAVTGNGGGLATDDIRATLIDRAVFDSNAAGDETPAVQNGGAIWIQGGDLAQIKNTTFRANYAEEGGGAISASTTIVLIENSTIYRNQKNSGTGSAIQLVTDATAAILYSTLFDNQRSPGASGSVLSIGQSSALSLGHSIVKSTGAELSSQCNLTSGSSSFTSLGYNIDTGDSYSSEPSDQPHSIPELAVPCDYGRRVCVRAEDLRMNPC